MQKLSVLYLIVNCVNLLAFVLVVLKHAPLLAFVRKRSTTVCTSTKNCVDHKLYFSNLVVLLASVLNCTSQHYVTWYIGKSCNLTSVPLFYHHPQSFANQPRTHRYYNGVLFWNLMVLHTQPMELFHQKYSNNTLE